MWRELWQKHRGAFCFAVGMVCFLAAGLLVQSLPGVRQKLEDAGSLPPRISASDTAKPGNASAPPRTSGPSVKSLNGGEATNVAAVQPDDSADSTGTRRDDEQWFLYITGSIRKPGVYRLSPGARLFQLVEAAGGLNNFADPVAINMAAPLEDGMHIHVPRKGERPDEGNSTIIVEPTVIPPAAPRSSVRYGSSAARAARVDINRATAEELTALKGIGPALAKNIVEYRSRNGRFRVVEDLLQVKGIGGKKLEGFRESVTVGP